MSYTISEERISGDHTHSRYTTDAKMYCGKCGQLADVLVERGGDGYFAYECTRTACCDESPYRDEALTDLFDYDALKGSNN